MSWKKWMLTPCVSDALLEETSSTSELHSGDSRMYPYQRTPMGNPYISPIVGIYGL